MRPLFTAAQATVNYDERPIGFTILFTALQTI